MLTQTVREVVGKKPSDDRQPSDAPKVTTTKIKSDLLRKARMVAAHRNIEIAQYVDSILRPAIERDYDEMISSEAKHKKGSQ
jgi:hypothetical protein